MPEPYATKTMQQKSKNSKNPSFLVSLFYMALLNISLKYFLFYLQVNQKREKLYKKQEELERRHREEEDRLIKAMLAERNEELNKFNQEEKGDWESKLKELTAKFDQEMSVGKKSGKYKKNDDLKVIFLVLYLY